MHALLTEHVLAGARPDRLAAFCLARVVAAPPCLAVEYKMRQRAPFRLRDERGLTLHLVPVIHGSMVRHGIDCNVRPFLILVKFFWPVESKYFC